MDAIERLGYSAEQVRAAERPLLDAGVPLMARAAGALAEVITELLGASSALDPTARVVVLAGSGDNGGDAMFAGAGLARAGARVVVVPVGSRLHEAAADAVRAAGGRVADPATPVEEVVTLVGDAAIVVDGIVGIGAQPGLRGRARELVHAILPLLDGADRPKVVAVDLPSGIGPDDGSAPGPVLRADVTVTFGAYKAGLLLSPGRELAGAVRLIDIGLGPALSGMEPLVRVIRRRVIVHGRVQGVGFRYATRERADALGVAGFVRNRADGTVEAELEGEAPAVERMLGWLHSGPPGARVSAVEVSAVDVSASDVEGADVEGIDIEPTRGFAVLSQS